MLYVRNRAYDPGTPGPDDVPIPGWIRISLTVLGAGQLLFAVALYLRPSLFIDDWPWPLTTLSARSLAAFAAFPAIAYLAFAFESRWSSLRWPFETAIAGLTLVAIGAARSSGNFDDGTVAWAWRGGMLVGLAFLVAVWLTMRREVGRAQLPSQP